MEESHHSKEVPVAVNDEAAVEIPNFEKVTNDTSASKGMVNEETDPRAQVHEKKAEEKPADASSKDRSPPNHATQCSVGLHELEDANTPWRHLTEACNHNLEICKECLSQYLATQVMQTTPDQIQCPTCEQRLDAAVMKDFADTATFDKYDRILLNQYLRNMLSPAEKFQECCNPKCDSGQICHPDKDSYIVCRDCQAKTCIGCDVLWHSAQSCEEYQATTKDEQALRQMEAEKGQAFIDSKCKRCPKCDFAELKDGGCDHVVCANPKCGYEYCWGCLADYHEILREDNTAHRTECPHHSENLPNPPEDLEPEDIEPEDTEPEGLETEASEAEIVDWDD